MSFGSGDAKYIVYASYVSAGGYYTESRVQLQYNNGGITVHNKSYSGSGTISSLDNDYLTFTSTYSTANTSVTITAKHDCIVYTTESAIGIQMSVGDTETFSFGDIRDSYKGLAIVFYD